PAAAQEPRRAADPPRHPPPGERRVTDVPAPVRIGVSRDALTMCGAEGELPLGELGLEGLDSLPAGVEWRILDEHGPELPAGALRDVAGLLLFGARLAAAAIHGASRLALVARWGVGYEHVDVEACTAAGVLVTITPDGVRRPLAEACVALLLAAALRLR